MRNTCWGVLILAAGLALPIATTGCQTGQPGVKTTGVVQYTTIAADLETSADAAAEVLEEMNLQNVSAQAGKLEGWAKGYMADGKEVEVELSHAGREATDVSVQVGTFGDTSMGKEIIARIREKVGDETFAAGSAATSDNTTAAARE
jgi:hypothetical protein